MGFPPGSLVAVVPAAGHARRLQPLLGSKEVYPVAGRPVMDYLIDRIQRTGCTDLRIVTRPEKSDVIAHARNRGLTVVLARPRSVSESLLAGLEGTNPEDIVLFGFPDTIWEPIDGFVRLLDALAGFRVALGLFRGREPERSDVVEMADSGLVTAIRVKPDAPGSDLIWGCAAARREALDALSTQPQPGVVLDSMCSRGEVVGITLSETFVDIGTAEALKDFESGRNS
jgi:NDP-sugar pyrophosphorylase family protein